MPSIRISDRLNVELVSGDAGPGSGFSKYFKGDVAGFVASAELALGLNKSIATLGNKPAGLGLAFADSGHFGSTGVEWTLDAGATATVQAAQAGAPVPGDDLFGDPLSVGAGQTFLGVVFNPTLNAGLSGAAGDLSFGFAGGGSLECRAGRAFDVTAAQPPTVGAALVTLLTSLVVPADVDDLRAMPPGELVSVSGAGQLKASGSFDLKAGLNPLATPAFGLQQIGAIELDASASITVGASVAISGRYQIRIAKTGPARARLAYFRMRGSELQFDVVASAGATATLAKKDLLALLAGLAGAPKVNVAELVALGLSEEQIDDIKAAVSASLNRSLSLSFAGAFGRTHEASAIFEFELDLDRLDAAGSEAVHAALDGDLSRLTAASTPPAGVTLLHNEIDTVRKSSATWKINLLGIVNVLHLTELVRTGKVLVDADTGDLVITDAVTGKTLSVETRPYEAERTKLRTLMMQSMILTAAYRASGVQKVLKLTSSMSYFERVASLRRQTVSDFLDNFLALGLITTDEKQGFLKAAFAGSGGVFLEVAFDDAAFEAMFIDPAGRAVTQEAYDADGRRSVAAIVQPGDENDFRRIPMLPEHDELWQQMTRLGQFAMREAMPPALRDGLPFALVSHDYTVVRWWSAAMSTAARRVVDMRQFLAARAADATSLKDNNDFKKKRADLEKALADVVSHAQPEFLDAWGLLAMDAAAKRRGTVRGVLTTAAAVLVKTR